MSGTVNEGGFAPGQHAINADDRHPATRQVARWFDFSHLPEGLPYETAQRICWLAADMLQLLPDDSPELTTGLRKLLEAKDCLVRAAIAAGDS